MDVDMEDVEIIFVQKLASGEPVTRKRALKALRDWISSEEFSNAFSEASVMRLCKGLHYVLWMQDKMLLQEELADSISSLINAFGDDRRCSVFIKCMFVTLSKEWARIDRWRMDKFLMFMRRLLRTLFIRLRDKKWERNLIELYLNTFKECVISADKSFSEGLKFHFASIYLDELDNAGGLERERVREFLEPYVQLLSNKTISDYLFDSVLQEVFVSILHLFAEDIADIEDREDESMKEGDSQGSLQFNYGEIGEMLFTVGKKPELRSDRRKYLYSVSRKFKAAEAGEVPFKMVSKEETKEKAIIPKKEFTNAVSRLLNEGARIADLREKTKKKKKAVKRKSMTVQLTFSPMGVGSNKGEKLIEKSGKQVSRIKKRRKRLMPPKLDDVHLKRSKKLANRKKIK